MVAKSSVTAAHQALWYVRPVLAGAPFIGLIPVRDTSEARGFYEGSSASASSKTRRSLSSSTLAARCWASPRCQNSQPFTIAGWRVPDITATAQSLAVRGVRFTRYDGMEQDELGIWTTPGGA